MTKQELLDDLSSRSFIKAVGEPELREEKPDGAHWYTVNVAEAFENVANYRNVDFYVFDEDKDSEEAFYRHEDPHMGVNPSALKEGIRQYLKDVSELAGWNFRRAEEYYGMAVMEGLKINDSDSSQVDPVMFLVIRKDDGSFEHKYINVSRDVVIQTSQV